MAQHPVKPSSTDCVRWASKPSLSAVSFQGISNAAIPLATAVAAIWRRAPISSGIGRPSSTPSVFAKPNAPNIKESTSASAMAATFSSPIAVSIITCSADAPRSESVRSKRAAATSSGVSTFGNTTAGRYRPDKAIRST